MTNVKPYTPAPGAPVLDMTMLREYAAREDLDRTQRTTADCALRGCRNSRAEIAMELGIRVR